MSQGTELQKYTYAYLMSTALSQVPDTIDKREGSIIYDALAPACYQLADYYMQLYTIVQETYVLTATGSWLEQRTMEYGISRQVATKAIKRADFTNQADQPMTISIGSRFSTISSTTPVTYQVVAQYLDSEGAAVAGAYRLECETEGIIGNEYTGNLIPISYVANIKTAVMSSILSPAQDVETDASLRNRYLAKVNAKSFGGNIAQYRELMLDMDGVGAVQVYPVWNGGGTVKLSVIDAEYNLVTTDFVNALQDMIDPENASPEPSTGLGLAPIGHKVTVVSPTGVACNISATLVLKAGYTIAGVQTLVETAIGAYLLELRELWGTSDELNNYSTSVYVARITSSILSVAGIANVTDVLLNGSASDLVLMENATTQQLPTLGTVTLSE